MHILDTITPSSTQKKKKNCAIIIVLHIFSIKF